MLSLQLLCFLRRLKNNNKKKHSQTFIPQIVLWKSFEFPMISFVYSTMRHCRFVQDGNKTKWKYISITINGKRDGKLFKEMLKKNWRYKYLISFFMLFKKVNEGIWNVYECQTERQNVILIRLLQRVMIQKKTKRWRNALECLRQKG